MKTVLVHGLGQTQSSWNDVVKHLENQSEIIAFDLFDLVKGKSVNYKNLFDSFEKYLINLNQPLNLCGISLGGILVLEFAIKNPKVVNSLILIGSRYNMPKTLFKIQNFVFKFMPSKTFTQMGIRKADFIKLSKSMIDIELKNDLENIKCNTLVICGEKDKVNMKASLELKNKISNANILIVKNAGHEVNLDKPKKLANAINSFFE